VYKLTHFVPKKNYVQSLTSYVIVKEHLFTEKYHPFKLKRPLKAAKNLNYDSK